MSFASFPAEIEQRIRREREGETEEGRFLSLRTSFADALSRKSRGADFGRFDKGKSFEAAALGERVISSK